MPAVIVLLKSDKSAIIKPICTQFLILWAGDKIAIIFHKLKITGIFNCEKIPFSMTDARFTDLVFPSENSTQRQFLPVTCMFLIVFIIQVD
jgi:hypothetical protein